MFVCKYSSANRNFFEYPFSLVIILSFWVGDRGSSRLRFLSKAGTGVRPVSAPASESSPSSMSSPSVPTPAACLVPGRGCLFGAALDAFLCLRPEPAPSSSRGGSCSRFSWISRAIRVVFHAETSLRKRLVLVKDCRLRTCSESRQMEKKAANHRLSQFLNQQLSRLSCYARPSGSS